MKLFNCPSSYFIEAITAAAAHEGNDLLVGAARAADRVPAQEGPRVCCSGALPERWKLLDA
jgi:hypothetical protein